jgi:arylsulfatase
MIKDHWKLTNFYDGPFELFNLEQDPTERVNLAEVEPEKYQEMITLVKQYAQDHGFSGDPQWDRPVGTVKRGWASDFWKGQLVSSIPDINSDQVPLDVKLSLTFEGEIDFNHTHGKKIRLQKYGDQQILWSADLEPSHPAQGKTTLVFEDFPDLEPGGHYYITWDAGWVCFKDRGEFRSIRACQESAYAFRFKTVTE